MELLDKANTETFGNPEPTKVTTNIEKGPFIIVSGHDLKDLQLLLEQTKDKGINIYTHGEMLPSHAYPELKNIRTLKEILAQLGKINKRSSPVFLPQFYSQQTVLCLQKIVTKIEFSQHQLLNIRNAFIFVTKKTFL